MFETPAQDCSWVTTVTKKKKKKKTSCPIRASHVVINQMSHPRTATHERACGLPINTADHHSCNPRYLLFYKDSKTPREAISCIITPPKPYLITTRPSCHKFLTPSTSMIVFNILGHNPKISNERLKNPANPTPHGLGPYPYLSVDSPTLGQTRSKFKM